MCVGMEQMEARMKQRPRPTAKARRKEWLCCGKGGDRQSQREHWCGRDAALPGGPFAQSRRKGAVQGFQCEHVLRGEGTLCSVCVHVCVCVCVCGVCVCLCVISPSPLYSLHFAGFSNPLSVKGSASPSPITETLFP